MNENRETPLCDTGNQYTSSLEKTIPIESDQSDNFNDKLLCNLSEKIISFFNIRKLFRKILHFIFINVRKQYKNQKYEFLII